jgi:bloom syndrome protein
VGVQVITSTTLTPAAAIVDEGWVEEEESEQETPRPSIPAQHRRLTPTDNIVQEFARPTLPTTIVTKSQPQGTVVDNSMGKLSSASRSTRPGLMSQHQLATPASTTNSTAVSSSLTKTYTTFLRESNGMFARGYLLID